MTIMPRRTLRPHQEPDEAEPRVLRPPEQLEARPWIVGTYLRVGGYQLLCVRCGTTTTSEDHRDDRIHFQALHSLCEEPATPTTDAPAPQAPRREAVRGRR